MSTLSHIFNRIQNTLFPWLEEALDPLSEKEEALDPLSEKEQKFIQVVSLMTPETHMKAYRWTGKGRKRKNRMQIKPVTELFSWFALSDSGRIKLIAKEV
jgi:hypothetical protein